MQSENINMQNLIDQSHDSSENSRKPARGNTGFRNLAAFHELLTRDGMCCPSLNSKFANKDSLSQMYMGKIFRLRQEDVV